MLRRTRWLAALLLIASPAFGGQMLAALHPCPATAPVAASAAHQHGAPAESGHDHDATQHCTCLGSCHVPAVAAPPEPQLRTVALAEPVLRAVWQSVESDIPAAFAVQKLPPKTAPPLA